VSLDNDAIPRKGYVILSGLQNFCEQILLACVLSNRGTKEGVGMDDDAAKFERGWFIRDVRKASERVDSWARSRMTRVVPPSVVNPDATARTPNGKGEEDGRATGAC
jgi:hypothetical protein